MSEIYVPAHDGTAEYTEKRSVFIGYVKHTASEAEAKAFINSIKKENSDARHNCWCYIIRDKAERYSDDGEPQGTAGVPMISVFKREGITDCACVVTRYFGGVLLGAPGLVRAYTRAASDALKDAGAVQMVSYSIFSVKCDYGLFSRIRSEIVSIGGAVHDVQYGEAVTITAAVPEGTSHAFCERIFDITAGKIMPEYIKDELFPGGA